MATTKKQEQPEAEKIKTCFIIMPIADHADYEKGHFDRVYDYLIKPACVKAGYQPVRADDSKASHMIMFDILKKIMDCDMAICDLSSKNANVFYELGLRQAFNKKTILITDGRDKAPFDISGFRYVTYTPSLRVDSVGREIEDIKEMLIETETAPEDDVNSIVKLLKIQPATVEKVELNQSESLIFDMMSKIEDKIDSLTSKRSGWENVLTSQHTHSVRASLSSSSDFEGPVHQTLLEYLASGGRIPSYKRFSIEGTELGILVEDDNEKLTFENKNTGVKSSFSNNYSNLKNIITSRRKRLIN